MNSAQSYEKSSEEQNKSICFLFRDGVASRLSRKVTKNAVNSVNKCSKK